LTHSSCLTFQSKNDIIDLTPGRPGWPRIYTEEEIKQWRREQVRKYYRENKEQCNFNKCLNFAPREWSSGKALISPQNQRVIKVYITRRK